MVIVIDNYDSFTYNLVQYLGELGADIQVYRNDAITVEEVRALNPDHILISPGPGTPEEGGVSMQIIAELGPEIPTLGVCLGHQAIGAVFEGDVLRAERLMHGKTSEVTHNNSTLFKDIPSPFTATRYHSLVVNEPLPDVLEPTAYTAEGELMGLEHKHYPIYGVQFHPESILTQYGHELLRNFLNVEKPK